MSAENSSSATGAGRAAGALRAAIVHHWFAQRGGAERVVEEIAAMIPSADIFTLLFSADALGARLAGRRVRASFLQRFPYSNRYHRFLMPLYPLALESLDLSGYGLVISSESGPAKGVLTRADCCHICYCHSPMRYLWDMYPQYKRTLPGGWPTRWLFALGSHYLRLWDYATAARVDFFAASSVNGARRIRKTYGRDAAIIHPPVDIRQFSVDVDRRSDDYYLVVGRLVAYKRIDLAVRACTLLRRRLIVVGRGEERRALARLAGPSVEFRDRADDAEVRWHMRRCRALLFPQEEDIGLVPIEVQASGRPVIAYGRGGALETVRPLEGAGDVGRATGLFFSEQTVEALVDAMRRFEAVEGGWRPDQIRAHTEQFSTERFRRQFGAYVEDCLRAKLGAPQARLAAAAR